jgi:hypothetical protein
MIPDEIWDQGPAVVNARIKKLIAEHSPETPVSEEKKEEPEKTQPSIEAVPSQGPGPRYRANEEGRIDRAPVVDIDERGNDIKTIDQLRPLVLRCAAELQTRLSLNQFPELIASVQSYRAALEPGGNRPIEWGEVWGLGVLLQNAAASAEREIRDRILPELEDPAKTALDSLLTLHGPMILATRDGAQLSETAAGFAMTREQQDTLRAAAQEVVERLKTSPEIITKRAAQSASDATKVIGQGPHPERGSVYGLANIKRVFAESSG